MQNCFCDSEPVDATPQKKCTHDQSEQEGWSRNMMTEKLYFEQKTGLNYAKRGSWLQRAL